MWTDVSYSSALTLLMQWSATLLMMLNTKFKFSCDWSSSVSARSTAFTSSVMIISRSFGILSYENITNTKLADIVTMYIVTYNGDVSQLWVGVCETLVKFNFSPDTSITAFSPNFINSGHIHCTIHTKSGQRSFSMSSWPPIAAPCCIDCLFWAECCVEYQAMNQDIS